jgi:phosphoribosyl 1,2-cyclic phosphate phosphodiesterase
MTSNEFKKILGANVLVVNALRKESHISHFSLDEAIAFAKASKIQRVYLTHLSHKMGLNAKINKVLPDGVSLAYDGLKIIIE